MRISDWSSDVCSSDLWRLHARIDRWEAPANIDNTDSYRCIHNRCANPFHRLGIGVWRHCLTADIETDTKGICVSTGSDQHFPCLFRKEAEFRSKASPHIFGGHARPDAQIYIISTSIEAP